jgi:hypothetical protein
MLRMPEAAELIAAEVLSAIPIDEPSPGPEPSDYQEDEGQEPARRPVADTRRPGWERYGALRGLIEGVTDDPFDLDARLRRALSLEQRLDARMGPLLFRMCSRWAHHALGYRTREAYARERLDMDPTRARTLVRLERAAMASEPFARAYRSGALSVVKASVLVPLVSADPLGKFMEEWIAWAQRITVRRLREDVDWALTLEDTDRAEFRRTGGLPADREIGAKHRKPAEDTLPAPVPPAGLTGDGEEPCMVRMIAPAGTVQLLRAILCTVRRRMEAEHGRMPSEGEALGVILEYVFACWGVGEMGVRPGRPPLATYRSGDVQVDV